MSSDKQEQVAQIKRWHQSIPVKIFTLTLGTLLIMLGVSSVVFGWWENRIGPNDKNTFITISKETTYFTDPVDELGFIDYAAAINGKLETGVTPETNFAVTIMQAVGPQIHNKTLHQTYTQALGIEPLPAEGDYYIPFYEHLDQHLTRAEESEQKLTERKGQLLERYGEVIAKPWNGKEHPEILSWLEANRIPLQKIEQGVKLPHYYRPIVVAADEEAEPQSSALINALLPDAQKHRDLSRALSIRAMYSIDAGDLEAAQRDLWTIHQLARHTRHGSTLIEVLVAIAIDNLACQGDIQLINHPDYTAEQARDYRQKLLKAGPIMTASQLGEVINERERIFGLDSVQSIARGLLTYEEIGSPIGTFGLGKTDWNKTLTVLNEHYDQIYNASQLKSHQERKRAIADWSTKYASTHQTLSSNILNTVLATAETRGEMMGHIFAGMLVPAAENSYLAADRAEMRWRLTITAIAIRESQKTAGRFPEKIEELVPQYLAEIPIDLFTENPLAYQPDAAKQEFLLYSFGPNLKDDNGYEREENDGEPDADDVAVRFLQK